MADRIYYCFCDSNCKFETMTKEQIFAAIAEATGNTPTEIDDAFITKLKEQNKGGTVTIWRGTVAEYNALVALGELDEDCIYIKTDEKPLDDINARIAGIEKELISAEKEISKNKNDISSVDKKVNEQGKTLNGVVETMQHMFSNDVNDFLYDGVNLLDGDAEIQFSTEDNNLSNQLSGICLGFVPYVDGAPKAYSVNWVFVPKFHVAAYNERSMTVMLNRYDFKSTGFKSFYITNDTIRGHASNVQSGTTESGIKYGCGVWALRYIIGV